MPNNYTPTAEHLAGYGYAPDERHTIWQLKGYSRQVPAPVLPYVAELVVQVNELNGLVYLTRHAKTVDELWPCHPLPTRQFFEQLLQALAWPVGPPLPEVPAATAELMLLRWITYHPAEAYLHRDKLSEYSCLPGLYDEGLVQEVVPAPAAVRPGMVPYQRSRPGLIEPTANGLDELQRCRHHRETPENLPAFIKQLTK
jgi:hypothetical protein